MKISINCKNISGSYGGVMSFYRSLKKYLTDEGHIVINHLKDDDIDIVLVAAYATWMTASYSYIDAFAYKIIHPKCLIVQRVNECDERKETKYMNQLLVDISRLSDCVVFVASWLKPLLEKSGLGKSKRFKVIPNGADRKIFNSTEKNIWNGKGKIKIVTHHWGGGYLKGHEIYQRLDKMLDNPLYGDRFEFTFVGNYPSNLKYKNARMLKPLEGLNLSQELKKHHVYLTASINEPGGMHSVEGAMCGLPLLYINSGCLPEYCDNYGIEFNKNNFEKKLEEMYSNYAYWEKKMKLYDQNSTKMTASYLNLFHELLEEKTEPKRNRNILPAYIIFFVLKMYSKLSSILLRIKMKIAFHCFIE